MKIQLVGGDAIHYDPPSTGTETVFVESTCGLGKAGVFVAYPGKKTNGDKVYGLVLSDDERRTMTPEMWVSEAQLTKWPVHWQADGDGTVFETGYPTREAAIKGAAQASAVWATEAWVTDPRGAEHGRLGDNVIARVHIYGGVSHASDVS